MDEREPPGDTRADRRRRQPARGALRCYVLVTTTRDVHTGGPTPTLGTLMPDADPTVPAPLRASGAPRRSFIARLGALAAALPLAGWRFPRPTQATEANTPTALQPNATTLAALGTAVLPSELGPDGVARAVADFQRWMDAYRPGAEANHGYGTGKIETVGADPRPRWTSQLAALDADARRSAGQSFATLTREQRQALVRASLAGERGESLPSPLAARHVAIALLAHFYESPAATDLCYDARIGRQQCRPLAVQWQEPVSLGRSTRQ